jgi:chemotaxis protein CheX
MPIDLCIEIHAEELFQIVESVFGIMLRLDLYPSEAPWFPHGDRLTSAVHLAGDWNGAIVVECDRRQACRFAGRFLSMEPSDTVDDVVRDVLGELANMIGGNVKGVLSSHIHLSMPSVMDGNDYSLRVCGAEIQQRLAFRCSEGVFWVTVLAVKS